MSVPVKIRLTTDLPIAKEHGCAKGKVFDAEYQHTRIDEEGKEVVDLSRGQPVQFTGDAGQLCVAFIREYEIVSQP